MVESATEMRVKQEAVQEQRARREGQTTDNETTDHETTDDETTDDEHGAKGKGRSAKRGRRTTDDGLSLPSAGHYLRMKSNLFSRGGFRRY
jgi:hypothetical protein